MSATCGTCRHWKPPSERACTRDPDYPPTEAEQTAARIAELEAQLAAARAALAACREVAGKRAGR